MVPPAGRARRSQTSLAENAYVSLSSRGSPEQDQIVVAKCGWQSRKRRLAFVRITMTFRTVPFPNSTLLAPFPSASSVRRT